MCWQRDEILRLRSFAPSLRMTKKKKKAQDDKRSEATAKRKGRERNEQRGRGENLLLQLQ